MPRRERFHDAGNLWRATVVSYDPNIMDLRALVVFPDQESASILVPVLCEMGMALEQTSSISRGLKLVSDERYDAILFEYGGEESSQEFLTRVRQSPKNRPAVLIAIVDEEFDARPLFRLGVNFVLYRPLSIERVRLSLVAARGLMRRERRRRSRAPVSLSVNVSYPGAPDLKATLTDLSDNGFAIATAGHLPDTGKVYFEFSLPGQRQIVRLSGEVAWQDSSGRTGVRFLDVPQASHSLIRSWLEKRSAEPKESAERPSTQKEPSSKEPEQSETTQKEPAHKPAALTTHQLPMSPQPSEVPLRALDAGNRRKAQRVACTIGAEVYQLGSKVPNRCTLSDLSEGGCYVEMPSPLDGKAGVEILVRTADMKFKIQGTILATHPGFGMGVRFKFRDAAEREEVLRLLGVLAAGPVLDEQSH
ncbi:MAG: PilZ domain-containing protein [Terriglobales bacterium]